MPKIIDADEFTIKALLDNPGSSFVVPRHQRQFEWTKEQWGDLWNDIQEGEISDSHFLGSIVVIPSDIAKIRINKFEVNDGQQRLTTILILLSVIRNHAKRLGNNEFAQFIDDHFLTSNYFEGGSRQIVPKMTLGHLDDHEFNKVCKGELLNNPQDTNHRIYECYNYFNSVISGINFEKLEELLERVTNKIIVVYINVADKLNAFRLFETLNDRGLALSAVDLIKNNLLMRAAADEDDVILNSIVEEWLVMYQKIRSYDPVVFFYRFMLSEYPGKITKEQLYEVISKKARDENWDAKYIYEFTIKLKKAAFVYSELMNANIGNEKINRRLSDIKFFEAGPSYTLLMKITPLFKNGQINEDQYLKVIELIELFHIRWGICGQSTSRLNDIYNRICNKLNMDDASNIPNIIEDEYLAVAQPISDSMFQVAFQNEFAQPSATRTKYIIWKLGNPAGEISLNFDEVHTEHILPQSLSSQWINELKISTGFEESEIKKNHRLLINKIGNFALIKGEWNISMSNKVFSEKSSYYRNSEIISTKNLVDYPSWNFDSVLERTEDLSKKAVEIWKFSKPIPTIDLSSISKESGGKILNINENTEIYCNGPNASAKATVIDQNIIRVQQGSTARKEIAESFKGHGYFNLREQLIKDNILVENGDSLKFLSDYNFQSPSAAAAVVLGRASNGQTDWKDVNGTSIWKLSANNDSEIDTRIESDFVKNMVQTIPEWINNEFPDGDMSLVYGSSKTERYLKNNGKTILYYYYAKTWIYMDLRGATSEEIEFLKAKLSKPDSIVQKGDWATRFHLVDDNDFHVLQEIIKKRVGDNK